MKSFLERLRTRRLATAFVVLAGLSAAILCISYAAHGVSGQEMQNASSDATPLKVSNSPVAAPNEFVKIAKQVGPAVVNINTQTLPKQSSSRMPHRLPHGRTAPQPQNPDDQDSPDGGQGGGQDGQGGFQDFFNHFFGGQGQDGEGDDGQVRESLGSGFIVDSKGYIITNNHVIEKADKIFVKLSTDPDTQDLGRPARVIGVDKATDIAVIKIDMNTPLPTVKLGNSDNTQVGDWVEAIGSPFALAQTVTAGIISAKNRTIEPGQQGQFQHFIQTDAAINPGNSGGPLLNMNGEVIGMNTAIYTQSAGYQGIGFAMPSNTIVDIYNDLVSPSHKVVRGSIGISFKQGLPGAVNRMYGFKSGVLVQYVQPGGPAEKAGLQPGDIIVTIDGRSIKDGDDLVNDIAARRPGSSARLGYIREGKQADATVTIGDRDKVFAEQAAAPAGPEPDQTVNPGESKLGIVVREATADTVAKLHHPGVAVQSVVNGAFADLQGMEPGLVIIRINRQPTGNRDQFNAVVSKLKTGDDVVFEVMDPRHPNDGINYIGGTL
ncbi:trypsin-like peptidase domain-containing protein [Terracidiphilus gabretensis]|uniref:trypsin-like peptidase domain-containing protein n=1 Tax=Terracidiphilus gabretensis TaxID=1577687 RepID=UPI00071B2370|nr:trypsin-like peptidase domain-containing protein [Terracidiphilus gabretensis]